MNTFNRYDTIIMKTKINKGFTMKKFISLILILLFSLQLTACNTSANNQSDESNLYNAGKDLILVMDEMINSKDYAYLIGVSNNILSLTDTIKANDYGSPIAVYSITLPDSTDFLKIAGGFDMSNWNNLSDNLKEQAENKFSFSTIINLINSQQGTDRITFSSIYTAFDKNDSINLKSTINYLYVFEKGTPIAITFSESGGVSGQFVFLENIDTLENAKSAFEKYNCSVSSVEIP